MKPILEHSHIYIDDIAVFERPVVRNAVANDLVDWSAQWFGELIVIEGRGVAIVLDDKVVDHFVDIISGHSGFDNWMAKV